jgi:hypothetical protein
MNKSYEQKEMLYGLHVYLSESESYSAWDLLLRLMILVEHL